MLIKLHWRCASNPNKVCFLQKSNGSSNGERGVKVEGRVSLPSGKICMGSFSQQMSTASRNPTPQVRLYLHALQPASMHCLSTPFQASGGLSYSIIFPTSSLPISSKTCAWCVFIFQSLSWDMEIKKPFPKSLKWIRGADWVMRGDDAPLPSPSSAGSAPDSINGPIGLPHHGLSPPEKYPPGWSDFPQVRKNKGLWVVRGEHNPEGLWWSLMPRVPQYSPFSPGPFIQAIISI